MNIELDRKQDGFEGETLIVLPTEAFADYVEHPLVKRLYLTDVGYFPQAAHHYKERKEGIEEYILLCCIRGKGAVELGEQTYFLKENDVFCVPCFQGHRYWADEADPWSILWVHFKGSDCAHYPLERCQVWHMASDEVVRRMEFLFNQLFAVLEQDYTLGNFIYLSQVLALILGEAYVRSQKNSQTALQNRQVTQAIRYMYQRLSQDLTLQQLAEEVGISKSTLSAAFQNCTGHAPMDFFIHLKMREACKLLRTGHHYIYEVAQRLGYHDPFYFSRLFKKTVGVSPKEYQYRGNDAAPI